MNTGRFRPFERLKSSSDFKQVFKQAQKTSGKNLLILWKPTQFATSRLGIIASKRVSKLAVSRNRIKRIIRDSFRQQKNQFERLDVIVIAKQPCTKLSKTELRKETDNLWKKLKIHSQKFLSA